MSIGGRSIKPWAIKAVELSNVVADLTDHSLASRHVAIEGQERIDFWSDQQLRVSVTTPQGDSRLVELDQPFALVGSHPDCDVCVDQHVLDPRTLLVCASSTGLVAVVLSTRAKKAGQAFRLPEHQQVPLGPCHVSFASVPASGERVGQPEDATVYSLTWKTSSGRHYAQLRQECPLIVGRKPPAAIQVADDRLSSLHCAVIRKDQRCWVIDLLSRNGTSSGGQRRRIHELSLDKSFVAGHQRMYFTALVPELLQRELQSSHDQLQAMLDQTSQHLREAIEDAAVQQANLLASLRGTQDQFIAQRSQFDAEMTKQQDLTAAQQARIAELEHDLVEKQSALAAREAREATLSDSKDDLQDALRALGESKQTLQGEVNSLSHVKRSLDGELEILEEFKLDLQCDLKTLTENKETMNAELRSLADSQQTLQNDLVALASSKRNLEDQLALLTHSKQSGGR